MKFWARRISLFWIAHAACISMLAQTPSLYFKRLNRTNGLSNNKVNCILQDQRGFTWIGTEDGLNRYDGNNFTVFKNIPGSPSSISGNSITDLHEDKDAVLWIATSDGGISRYDYRLPLAKQFRQFKHQPGDSSSIPINIINVIREDKNGYLWLATSGEAVLRFDKKTERFVKPQGLGQWTIHDLCFDKHGIIWAGREGRSILKIDPQKMQATVDPGYTDLYTAKPHMVVTTLFKDSKDHIWFGSWDKAVYRHNALTDTEEVFVPQPGNEFSFKKDEPLSFNEDAEGRIWIGGKHYGLYVYHPSSGQFFNYQFDNAREGTLSSNTVNCIYMDRSGNVWVGTSKGISFYQQSHKQYIQQFLPGHDDVAGQPLLLYDFHTDSSGDLWIGTNRGLFIRDRNGNFICKKLTYKGTPLQITSIFRDSDGGYYLGTQYTLFRYNVRLGTVSLLPATDKDPVMARLIESRITGILRDTIDARPVLITVPYGHYFSYYDMDIGRWVSRSDSVQGITERYGISDYLIRKIYKTKDGTLWLANARKGLIRLNKSHHGHVSYINNPGSASSITNNNVYDLAEDSKGNLWISTYGGGLNYFNTKTNEFAHYASDNNLLEGLTLDRQGNVWMVTNGGLQKFNTLTKTFTTVALPDVEKTGGVKGSVFTDQSGQLIVAGEGYFIEVNPTGVSGRTLQPKVVLTDFSIFDSSYSHLLSEKTISLGYRQNFFTFHFSAPDYSGSAPVQYAYMLEGVDKDWIIAGASTQANYTNLGAGQYNFKVKATISPGSWSREVTTIPIIIMPPFWQRWWFFGLCALLISAIAYGIYLYRIQELMKRQTIRNKIAQDLHDNVGSTLSSISVYSQVAKIYKEKNRQDELQHTLERISSTSSEMISEMNDIVWAINPRNDSMDVILQRMESYAKPLLNSQGIQYNFEFDPALLGINLQMSARKNFYLIFKEAINNAVKYADCKFLSVKIKRERNEIQLVIMDDGKGFDTEFARSGNPASLSGNGLPNMHMRAREVNGTLHIVSSPGLGTTIDLRFPV